MRALALTTQQIKFGVMIERSQGYLFFPLWLATIYVLTWLAGVLARLSADVFTVYAHIGDALLSQVAHHATVFQLGLQVVIKAVLYGIPG